MESDRLDKKLDAAVNRALAAALLDGMRAGVKIMVDEGVPPKVAVRVFLTPQHRRATDWTH
jgi:hypothetical protein